MKKVAFIFLKKENKFLFYLRDNKTTIPHPNHWALIGGGLENDELPLDALKREIKEEINIEVSHPEFIDVAYHSTECNNSEHLIYFFRGTISKEVEEINLTEGQRLNYFSFEEMKNLKTPPIIKKFILEHENYLLT